MGRTVLITTCWVVMGIASPSAAQIPSGEVPPPFSVNHVGCVVEQATIDAVASSEFLTNEFANVMPFEAATSEGESWSNHTIWGELTYIEFLTPESADQLGLEMGDCFLALHAEEAGGVQWLADQMSARYPESNPRVRFREFVRGAEQIPWAYLVTFDYDSGASRFGVWATEYHPQFKHRMAPAQYPEPGDISRLRKGPRVAFHAEKYFRDVAGLQVAVSALRRSQLVELFSLIGMTPEDRGASTVWKGKDFEVEVAVAPDSPDFALRAVRLDLTRPKTGQRAYQFGPSARLRFGERAVASLDLGR